MPNSGIQDYDSSLPLNQTFRDEISLLAPPKKTGGQGQDSSESVQNKLKNVANLVQSKIKSDGGLNHQELNTMFAKSGLDRSPNIDKFNALDTNKNGKLEESEITGNILRN